MPFDASMFNPQTYQGGQSGWLLDALRSGLLGGALGQTPTPAPAESPQTGPTFANGQNGAMGGVPFNILGQQPQQAQLPPNAQPAQYQPQQQAPQQSMGDLFPKPNGVTQFFNMFSRNGPGTQTYAAAQQQAALQATYQSLKASGVPDGVAQAAALNPEILKTIAPAYFDTAPKLQETGTDPLTGQKSFATYKPNNPGALTAAPIGGANTQTSQGSLGAFSDAIQRGVTGEALYEFVPPAMRNIVKGMVEGRQQPPTGAAMRSPQTMALIDMAHSIDPTFDSGTWGARFASQKDFSAGKSSEMVRAANQTLHHVGALLDSMDKLGNTQYPMYNAVGNAINQKVLGKGAVTEFLPNAHAVAEEMSKVFKGANLSDAEVRQWEQSLNENMSPEQQHAAVGKLVELLNGSLQALGDKRERGMGPVAASKAGPILNADSQKVMDRVSGWIRGESAQQPPAPQTAPTATGPGGQKLMLKGNQWVPVK